MQAATSGWVHRIWVPMLLLKILRVHPNIKALGSCRSSVGALAASVGVGSTRIFVPRSFGAKSAGGV
jgi:hypothetical protein